MEDINIDSTSSPSTKSEENFKEDGSSVKYSDGSSGVRNSQRLREKAALQKKLVDDITSIDDSDANLKEEVEKCIFSSTLTMIDKAGSKKVSGRKLPSSKSKSHVPTSAKKMKTGSKLKFRRRR